jgi:hypothetical protein
MVRWAGGRRVIWPVAAILAIVVVSASITWGVVSSRVPPGAATSAAADEIAPRRPIDTSGFLAVYMNMREWDPNDLADLAAKWRGIGAYLERGADERLNVEKDPFERFQLEMTKAMIRAYDGDSKGAYGLVSALREKTIRDPEQRRMGLGSLIYYQGVLALRMGEDANCVACRGESSCLLPISPGAVHADRRGSELAMKHFGEYLTFFPDDLEVKWLLNLAAMTLGEWPEGVDPGNRLSIDMSGQREPSIGRFREVGQEAGIDIVTQSGGAIMDDFDLDGFYDLFITAIDPTEPARYFRNRGDGTFEDATATSGLQGQTGGLYCVQADYDNDGLVDVFIVRGAWYPRPVRPSLMRNLGGGTFADVTAAAGVGRPTTANTAAWADYDQDGYLDLIIPGEQHPNLLYRNLGNGRFEEVAEKAGVARTGSFGKGATWVDIDNDDDPDLFLNHLDTPAKLYRNEGDGTFRDVTSEYGILGPNKGFPCWSWDYDNDGWLDIMATSYDFKLESIVKGLMGRGHNSESGKLYRNLGGNGFADVTRDAGVDGCYTTMGCNFADLDGDGFLDFYLGTGSPSYDILVPNRLFRNMGGKRFAEISYSSGTAHLQKGHAVAIGDYDRGGDVDIFEEMGGAVNGDKYHNVLFNNPGQGNGWISVKLRGETTNRSAIGVRIKVEASEPEPMAVYRHVGSGASFGANPLEQNIGLGKARGLVALEIRWPTSHTTQRVEGVPINQVIEITESEPGYRVIDRAIAKRDGG